MTFRFCSPFGVCAVVSTCISLPPLSSFRTSFDVIDVPFTERGAPQLLKGAGRPERREDGLVAMVPDDAITES